MEIPKLLKQKYWFPVEQRDRNSEVILLRQHLYQHDQRKEPLLFSVKIKGFAICLEQCKNFVLHQMTQCA